MFNRRRKAEPKPDAQIHRIVVYPIKSLDGISVQKAAVGPTGGLVFDRRFCLVDASGKIVNGKREPKIHAIRSTFDLDGGTVGLSAPGFGELQARLFPEFESKKIGDWFSEFFGREIEIQDAGAGGFPDDTDCPGPTFVTVKTLERVRAWIGLEAEDLVTFARRFRTNIEIDGAPAFWDDQLISASGARFFAGDVLFTGMRASARCVVPSRHPISGAVTPNFSKIFSDHRRRELPVWTDAALFDHTYRLCVNTRIAHAQPGAALSVGDPVKLELDFDISI